MQVVSAHFVQDKVVLLRMDLDVPLDNGKIVEDFRLRVGLPTLQLCLDHAKQVIIIGHLGRPEGKENPSLSIAPIHQWLEDNGFSHQLQSGKLQLLENLRFEPGEEAADPQFAHQIAKLGDVFVNESFAAHHPAASTTVIPRLLPHAAGLHFAQEVKVLQAVRHEPKKPLIAIVGGIKIEDKYPSVQGLANFCDKVLVGGLLAQKIKDQGLPVAHNVILGVVDGIDMSEHTINYFCDILKDAKQIIWAGPVGKYEEAHGNKGNLSLAQAAIASGAEVIIGGGDTEAALAKNLDQFHFVSSGGGAMLKLLIDGTLPTIAVL